MNIDSNVDGDELATYAYSYPHKSSYRALAPAVPIREAWRVEDRSTLFLYLHVPFCEMRCGFCNLFTQSQPRDDLVDAYLRALLRQMRAVRSSLPDARFAQFAVGGGTPTYLSAPQIELVFCQLERTFGFSIRAACASVEASPGTVDNDRLRTLSEFGVERLSLGVQSFVGEETGRIGRPQYAGQVHAALERIRAFSFPRLNIDLIYGDRQQTAESWTASLRQALQYRPEEIYLYPLYVRPETGLARRGPCHAKHRADLYRLGRDLLLSEGYSQGSLRCFYRPFAESRRSAYVCQRDGMVGLGCGARSYTRDLHYATKFATTQAGVRAILRDWIRQTDDELALATHGIRLTDDEQRRRFVILSLLQADGLDRVEYARRFRADPHADLPELSQLVERGWIACSPDRIWLTPAGLENSDSIGPRLYSPAVRARLKEFVRS